MTILLDDTSRAQTRRWLEGHSPSTQRDQALAIFDHYVHAENDDDDIATEDELASVKNCRYPQTF